MIAADNTHCEVANRVRGIAPGGIDAMLLLALRTGLIPDINARLHLLERPLPFHESHHILMANGRCDQGNLVSTPQVRHARAHGTGGRVSDQLGVDGHGRLGLEPEGVSDAAGARVPPACSEASNREAGPAPNGVPSVLRGDYRGYLPCRSGDPAADLPAIVVEPVDRRMLEARQVVPRLLGVPSLAPSKAAPDTRVCMSLLTVGGSSSRAEGAGRGVLGMRPDKERRCGLAAHCTQEICVNLTLVFGLT